MQVTYLSEARAIECVPGPQAAMISITEPRRAAELPNPEAWGALLRAQFSDAEYDAGMIARLKSQRIAFDPAAKGFPSRKDAEAILNFLDSLRGRSDIVELIVHCHSGKRRSAAVAKYAAQMFNADFDHSYDEYNKTVYDLLLNPARYHQEKPATWLDKLLGRRHD